MRQFRTINPDDLPVGCLVEWSTVATIDNGPIKKSYRGLVIENDGGSIVVRAIGIKGKANSLVVFGPPDLVAFRVKRIV
tara:strand:- start:826 stop:1062 length:237 start_codon:yes stop_codon:yes gene_type:complete